MAVALKHEFEPLKEAHQAEVRKLVLAGLEQIKEGKTKAFDEVCDRLEKKYEDAAI